jgi:AraC-like DNA-binding protein
MSWYSSFATDEPEVAEEFLAGAYLDVRLRLADADEEPPFRLADNRLDAGPFQIDDLEIAAEAAFDYEPDGPSPDDEPDGKYFVSRLTRGTLRVLQDGVDESLARGEIALIGRPGVKTRTEIADFRQDVVTLRAPALREAAGIDLESEELPNFHSIRPISPARAASWRRTLNYVGAMLRGDPAIAEAPLVVSSANRLLAGVLLTTFPNDAIEEPERRDERDAHSVAALRRAVAFIDASADLDIGIGDIAAAAGMSRRAIQLAFRRHLDTTPTAYLRRVRLDGAHRELLGALPDSGVTVTEVAYRWGFSSPSRFAERYRAAYGVSPSESLRG